MGQMMKVVGEEGTSTDDYVTYQKGEFLDAVYLQQNTFDDVDAASSEDRQREIFDLIMTVMDGSFTFEEKDDARSYFNTLRQLFVDCNYIKYETDEFEKQKQAIDAALKEALDA